MGRMSLRFLLLDPERLNIFLKTFFTFSHWVKHSPPPPPGVGEDTGHKPYYLQTKSRPLFSLHTSELAEWVNFVDSAIVRLSM